MNETRRVSWKAIIGLAVVCIVIAAAAFRAGLNRGKAQQAESHILEGAGNHEMVESLSSTLLPLKVCARRPDAFTSSEKRYLIALAESRLGFVEPVIPALEAGRTYPEPFELNAAYLKKTVAEVRGLLGQIKQTDGKAG